MAKPTGHGGIDYPDFIQSTTPHENPVEITLAELAIRLGFPHVFERTGNVLYYETFEYGISDWNPAGNIAANKPVLSSRALLASPYSAKLIIDGTAAAFSYIAKQVAFPYISTYGIEFSFLPSTSIGQLYFGVQIFTGTYKYDATCCYDDSTYKWSILDDTPAYQEIATYDIGAWNAEVWHPVKLVFDVVNGVYARMMVDDKDYGISSYTLNVAADNTPPYLLIYVQTFVLGTRVYNINVDNVILTINEPL